MKMLRFSGVVSLALAFAIGGCATNPAEPVVNSEKAAEINAQLGLRYMMQGQNERAMEKLKHALSFESDYGPAHHYLGELYRRLERPLDAERHYRIAVRQQPNDSALLNNFGVFLCGQGKPEDAEKQFLKVLENPVYQPRAQVYENLGLCMRDQVPQKGERYLRQALDLNARMPKALLAMADLAYEGGRYLSARAYLQRHLEVARPSPESLWLGIRIERVLGDRDALASYEMLLKNNFSNSEQARLYRESL